MSQGNLLGAKLLSFIKTSPLKEKENQVKVEEKNPSLQSALAHLKEVLIKNPTTPADDSQCNSTTEKLCADSGEYPVKSELPLEPVFDGSNNNEKPEITTNNKKPGVLSRTCKQNYGSMTIMIKNSKTNQESFVFNGYKLRPGLPLNISWILPIEMKDKKIALGLFRYGCQTNDGGLITKSIEDFNEENDVIKGTIKFFAPKSAGQYVFRILDPSSKETLNETLVISNMFTVVLMENDILSNLQYVVAAFDENSPHKALGLFQIMMKFIKSHSNDSTEIVKALSKCVTKILSLIQETMIVADEGYRKKLEQRLKKSNENPQENEETVEETEKMVDEDDAEFWRTYRNSIKLQNECYEALMTLQSCKTPWYWVSERQKTAIQKQNELHCPFLKRYFRDDKSRDLARVEIMSFSPSYVDCVVNEHLLNHLSKRFGEKLKTIIPHSRFTTDRAEIKDRIQMKLQQSGFLRSGLELVVYGSSANGFGNPGSDIDLCLKDAAPSSASIDKLRIMCDLADSLTEVGMLEVKPLLTARVPIIEFIEPVSGLSCDVAYHNSLALANTALLQTYGKIDERVRQMAYFVKYWAKLRNINSPQQGTLGSYGYLITVIYFLQNRPDPILPFLQNIQAPSEGTTEFILQGKEVWEKHGIDGSPCNLYFLKPTEKQLALLQQKAKKNKETLSMLLYEYFRFYAYNFDFRHQVVSIRKPELVMKIDKYEYCCWPHSENLSIEDPFEIHYDVAHVIRPSKMTVIRREFLRAFTILSRSAEVDGRTTETDSIPSAISENDILNVLCEENIETVSTLEK